MQVFYGNNFSPPVVTQYCVVLYDRLYSERSDSRPQYSHQTAFSVSGCAVPMTSYTFPAQGFLLLASHTASHWPPLNKFQTQVKCQNLVFHHCSP